MNAIVKVVYTADAGRMFPGGYRTFTTNITASAELTTVTLAADQQPVAAKACTDCITFSAEEAFGIKMTKRGTPSVNPSLEYSTDQTYWETFSKDDGAAANADHKLYLRGTGNTAFAANTSKYYAFTNTPDSVATAIACSGNIETLLDYRTVASGNHPEMAKYAFCGLFKRFASLTAAPELPATNLSELCYNSMFNGCTSLTAAPELPATNLAASCYVSMFSGCTSLTAAPELPATNLAASCYWTMFYGCTSLTAVPELPALNLQDGCYSGMFSGCASLTAAPELPAKKLATYCYSSMFGGCTSLTAAPELPATNLATSCYMSMFSGCASLTVNTTAPGKAWSIPAEAATSAATADDWSGHMFVGTPGDITNTTVTCGRAYYIASAAATIDVAKPEHATYEAFTNGIPVAVPCTVNYITPVGVVYEADEGYAFADGSKTFTTNVTASAAVTTVTLAADQLPGTPKVQLGVVAQRYPWNGIMDVNYKTTYVPAEQYRLRLKVEVEGFDPQETTCTAASGIGSVAFDLREAFGDVKGQAKVTATLEQMPN